MVHINFVSKKEYAGVNQEILENAAASRGFRSEKWMTYVQAKIVKKQVQKGAKGVQLIKYIEVDDVKTKKTKKVPVRFTVFNEEQVS